MQYREDKYGNKLSVLGYGCMRFTKKGNHTDIEKAERELLTAYNQGVNYFDTAYVYGDSERVLGDIVKRNQLRDKIYIATKLPQYMIRRYEQLDRYLEEELERLQTDYIDYYLMHHVTDIAQWEKLKELGIEKWIQEKKEQGIIHNIGFSYHGNSDNFLKVLNDYDWDFCQIQYNYLDEVTQAGVIGLKAAYDKGIPVIIMEPLRGGKLVNMLPPKARRIVEKSPRHYSAAKWALSWLYNQKEVTVVLSGMNSVDMVNDNCQTATAMTPGCLTQEDLETIQQIKEAILENEKVGCTGCRYCMPCSQGVDIPGIFRCYNTMYTESKREGRFQFAQTVGLTEKPAFASQCVECGLCEKHCPQMINIREKLKEADKALRPLPYKVGINIVRWYMFHRRKPKSENA